MKLPDDNGPPPESGEPSTETAPAEEVPAPADEPSLLSPTGDDDRDTRKCVVWWDAVLAQLLKRLGDDDVAEVLYDADREELDEVLRESHLGAAKRARGTLSQRARYKMIAPEFKKALPGEHRAAGRVVLTAWGQWAKGQLADTSLAPKLRQTPLTARFGLVRRLVLDDREIAIEDLMARARNGASSAIHTERLFWALLMAGLESEGSAALGRRMREVFPEIDLSDRNATPLAAEEGAAHPAPCDVLLEQESKGTRAPASDARDQGVADTGTESARDDSESNVDHDPSAGQEKIEPVASHSDPVLQGEPYQELLHHLRVLKSDPTVEESRRSVEFLRAEVGRVQQTLQDIDERARRVRNLRETVLGLGLVRIKADSSYCVPNLARMRLSSAVETVRRLETDIEGLLQLHLQAEALDGRLQGDGKGRSPLIVEDLHAAIRGLQDLVEQLNVEIASIAETARKVEEFVGEFGTTDELSRPLLLSRAPRQTWEMLAGFIAERNACGLDGSSVLPGGSTHQLLSALLTRIWASAPEQARKIAGSAMKKASDRAAVIDTLSYLSFPQMQEIALERPGLAPLLAEVLLAASVGREHAESLEYLDPWLHNDTLERPVRAFYSWALDRHRRGEELNLDDEKSAPAQGEDNAPPIASEKLRRQILDMIELQPGMKGNYHRLRSIARVQFLIPLRADIERKDARKALTNWRDSGAIDDMVESCIRSFGAMKVPNPLSRRHEIQTRSYLESFDKLLEKWANVGGRMQKPEDATRSREILSDLRGAAAHNSAQSASLLRTIEGLRTPGGGGEALPPVDFGHRTFSDGSSLFVNPEVALQPEMTHGWPYAFRDESVVGSRVMA
jgi:uncharacterized protein YukE